MCWHPDYDSFTNFNPFCFGAEYLLQAASIFLLAGDTGTSQVLLLTFNNEKNARPSLSEFWVSVG